MSGALLQVDDLTMRFGGLLAIDHLSFAAEDQKITAVIGPNGAGKTTVFNCLTGFYRPSAGSLGLRRGEKHLRLEHMEGWRIARDAGIARTFQNIRLFAGMTVLENLVVAQHTKLMRASGWSIAGLLGLSGYRAAEAAAIDRACHWLDRIGLTGRADQVAGTLAYGDQRRLEIARAMCTEPVLLCLDEPAAGLNPRESAELNRLLLSIRDRDRVAILLIEHDMNVVMGISDRVVVLDYGKKIADGTAQEVRRDPAVIKAYLGEPEFMTALLSVADVHTFYGNIEALKGVDLVVEEGEIVTLIGANGAGKSTLLMTICGKPQAAQGSIHFASEPITHLPTDAIIRRGISHAPEGRRIFPRMTVLENLQMGAIVAGPEHFVADLERVLTLFPILKSRQSQRGGTLSGGEQQMLAIARALMSRPRLLLLDEPSLGLAPLIVKQIFDVIRAINQEQKITVFLVEQNAHHALRLAHRGYVMQTGHITLTGTGTELLADEQVRAAYLEGGG